VLALVVDGLNLVRRVYAAVQSSLDAQDHLDAATASIVGSAVRAVNETSPTHALGVFECEGKNWRHQLYPMYKAHRPAMPEPLRQGLPKIQQALADRGLKSISVPGFEADDVIASVAYKVACRGGNVVVLSTDKSMCQLLGDRIRVRDHFNQRYLDEEYVQDRFGVEPAMLPSWLALVGDRSLNVPGVRTVGPRTAKQLINQFGSLQSILEAAPTIKGKLGKTLQQHSDDAYLSLRLVTLRKDVDVGVNLSQFRYTQQRG